MRTILPMNLSLVAIAAALVAVTACSAPQQAPEPDTFDAEPVSQADQPDDPFASSGTIDDPFGPAEGERRALADDSREAVEEALELARSGDIGQARADLEQLVDDEAVGPWALYNLGVIAFYERQVDVALDYFEDALDAEPTLAPALAGIVRYQLSVGNVSAARTAVDRAISQSNDAPEIRAVRLYLLLYEARYEEVIRQAREILLEDDDNLDVHFAMGQANFRLGRVELARYIYEQGLERDGNRPDLYFGLAEIAISEENNPGARTWLNRALEVDPQHPEAWNNLGLMQLRTRAYEDARESFENATRYAPQFEEAWLNLGNALKGLGQYAEARDAFLRAAEIDTSYADPYFNLGVLYLDAELDGLDRLARLQQSMDYFDEFIDVAGGLPESHPVYEYRGEAQRLYDTEMELGSGGGDSDPFGDDFSDDSSGDDAFGDDEFGDDDFGDDDFGDDDFGDDEFDFGDDEFSDDDFGDDEFDFGDEEFEDEESDDDRSEEEEEEDPFGDDEFEFDDEGDPFADDPFAE